MKNQNEKRKALLQEEYEKLIEELETVGRVNPDNPFDWEPKPPEHETDPDQNVAADTYEEYENNTAILKQLEVRFNKVKSALDRIEKGGYGVCENCKKPIEEKRLDADPASSTCLAHMV